MGLRIGIVGLVLLALFTWGSLLASAAHATGFVISSEAKETTLTGAQVGEDVLSTTAGTVLCEEATYTGSLAESGEAASFELTPSYSECTAFGFANATVSMNGCKYLFKTGAIEGGKYEGTTDITCPAGKEIAIVAKLFGTTKCTVNIPAQSKLGTVTFTNSGSGTTREVSTDVDIEGKISYSEKAGTGFGACANGSASNGSFEGSALITGDSGGAHVGLQADNSATSLIEITPPFHLEFEADAQNQITRVRVKNTGIQKMTIGKSIVTPDENDFKVEKSCAGPLNGGEACEIEVEFISGQHGLFSRWLEIWFGRADPEGHTRKLDVTS